MNPYCAVDLDARAGSCYLVFCAGRCDEADKFDRDGALFVLDHAFFVLGVETAFKSAVPGFDPFEETRVTQAQWRDVYRFSKTLDDESRDVIEEINRWAMRVFSHEEEFTVLGV